MNIWGICGCFRESLMEKFTFKNASIISTMIIIKCKRCGFEFGRIDPEAAAFITINSILNKYGYRCPRCIRRISNDSREWRFKVGKAKLLVKAESRF
ncbi:MAG: hypothetical protein J7L38_06025 [Thermoproteales archaeon]|nr:hypothetical protein [Thermoproteales archaeon]